MLEFDVSLLQIQVFLAVAEQHSFSKAAEQVNLEQSTVSRRIGVLERELGVRLFRREERPVGLTEAGELLYSRWRPLLAAFEQSVQVLERFRTTGASRLRVCTVDSLNVLNDMPEVRNALLRRQPEADLSFEYASFSQWRSKLLRDEVDVVLTIAFDAGEAETELEQEEICTCPKLVCMLRSNPLARKERVTYEDLRGQRFVGIGDAPVCGLRAGDLPAARRLHAGYRGVDLQRARTDQRAAAGRRGAGVRPVPAGLCKPAAAGFPPAGHMERSVRRPAAGKRQPPADGFWRNCAVITAEGAGPARPFGSESPPPGARAQPASAVAGRRGGPASRLRRIK